MRLDVDYIRPLSGMSPLRRVPDEAGPPGQMRDGIRDLLLKDTSHLKRDLKWAKTRHAVLYFESLAWWRTSGGITTPNALRLLKMA